MSVDVMNSRPYVSIIVAVYNVETYIAQCCHSLFSQTLDRVEYIFVDDCSPDKSINVVQSVLVEYPNRTSQVKIVRHPVNMGISRTREDGVKVATGEYIIHCDPDDWVELDMYERLYHRAVYENADMVLCGAINHNPDLSICPEMNRPKVLSSSSMLASILHSQQPILPCCLWDKLVRYEYYQNIKWPEDISFGEDCIVLTQILLSPLKISYVAQTYYHYRRYRQGALACPQYTKESVDNRMRMLTELHQVIIDSGNAEALGWWDAYVPMFMMFALQSSNKIYTNREYGSRFNRYKDSIRKDKSLSFIDKILLSCATYNYSLAFLLYHAKKRIGHFFKG